MAANDPNYPHDRSKASGHSLDASFRPLPSANPDLPPREPSEADREANAFATLVKRVFFEPSGDFAPPVREWTADETRLLDRARATLDDASQCARVSLEHRNPSEASKILCAVLDHVSCVLAPYDDTVVAATELFAESLARNGDVSAAIDALTALITANNEIGGCPLALHIRLDTRIAEIYTARGRKAEARPFFERAAAAASLLGDDESRWRIKQRMDDLLLGPPTQQ